MWRRPGEESCIRTLGNRRHIPTIVIYQFILSVFATQVVLFPDIYGNVVALLAYGVLCLYMYLRNGLKIAGDRSLMIAILFISILFVIPFLRSPGLSGLPRMLIFPTVILINFFIIPQSIPRETFYGGLSRLTALCVLLGLPAVVLGSFGPIPSYGIISDPLGLPIEISALTSLFTNPNTMGAIAVFGTLAGIWEYYSTGSLVALFLAIVNISGVYLSQGRAAALALFVALFLLIVFSTAGYRSLVAVSLFGIVSAPILLLIKFGILPGPGFIQGVDFNNRIELWTAAYQAFLDRPLFGWGIGETPRAMISHLDQQRFHGQGPHNSYVRMFVASGVFGGLTYLFICGKCALDRLWTVKTKRNAVEFGMVAAALIFHTFGGNSIFGLAIVSVIPAIILGYAQQSLYNGPW